MLGLGAGVQTCTLINSTSNTTEAYNFYHGTTLATLNRFFC